MNFLISFSCWMIIVSGFSACAQNGVEQLEQEMAASLEITLKSPLYRETLDLYEDRLVLTGTLPSKDRAGYRAMLTNLAEEGDIGILSDNASMILGAYASPIHLQGLSETIQAFETRVAKLPDNTSLKGLYALIDTIRNASDFGPSDFCTSLRDAFTNEDWEKPFYQDMALMMLLSITNYNAIQVEPPPPPPGR